MVVVGFVFWMVEQLFLGGGQAAQLFGDQITDPSRERQSHSGRLTLGQTLQRRIQRDIRSSFLQREILRLFLGSTKSFIFIYPFEVTRFAHTMRINDGTNA